MIYIGIDTGVDTGYAEWSTVQRCFISVRTLKIHKAMSYVKDLHETHPGEVIVRIEDARLRKWFGTERMTREEERTRLQGVGSVKRDAVVWEDFLHDIGVKFEMVAPRHNVTKLGSDQFKAYTKWAKRTSEHARDAAMLVFGL